jgi:pimeloyl-ACP methyl ester carboxylesterase
MKNDAAATLGRTPRMISWPALAPYARELELPETKVRLFLYDTGAEAREGLPLVLIHGLGDEADSWRSLIPLLAQDSRVVALDLPGFGRSTSRRRATFARHTEAVIGVLKETGRSILVGSSMGAAIAESVAFKVPEKVAGLVLLDGGLPAGGDLSPSQMLRMLTPILGERIYRAFRKNHEAAYRSLEPYYADLGAMPDNEKAFLRNRVIDRVESEKQLRGYFSSLRSFVATAVVSGSSYGPKLAAFPGRVLIGWGERDLIMPLSAAEVLRKERFDADFVVFSGSGHLPHQEKPAAVADAITAFLAAI